MADNTTPILGINLGLSTATDNGVDLGTIVSADDGGQYVRVQASAAITPNSSSGRPVVAITTAFAAKMAAGGQDQDDFGGGIGIGPNTSVASGDYFWAQISGPATIRAAGLTPKNVALFTSAEAGALSTTSGGSGTHSKIEGLSLNTAATTGAATTGATLTEAATPAKSVNSMYVSI